MRVQITHTSPQNGIRFVLQTADQNRTGYDLIKVEKIKKADLPNTKTIETLSQLNEVEVDHGQQ